MAKKANLEEKVVKKTAVKQKKKEEKVKAKKEPIVVKKDSELVVNFSPIYLPIAIVIASVLFLLGVVLLLSNQSIFGGQKFECDKLDRLSLGCLKEYAREAKLKTSKFDKCLEEEKYNDVIDQELESAEDVNLRGTPHVIIGKYENDKVKGFYAGGAQEASYYEELIEGLKTKSLEEVRDQLILDNYGTKEEILVKIKEAYSSQGVSDEDLTEYAQKALDTELALYDVREYELGDGLSIGDKKASIVLIAYSDYECPYCQIFAQDTLSELKEKYIDKNEVRFVFRDYPIESSHPKARRAAIAARCAAEQGKYPVYHDLLFGVTQK